MYDEAGFEQPPKWATWPPRWAAWPIMLPSCLELCPRSGLILIPWDQTRILPFCLLFVLAWFLCLVVTCGLKGYRAKPHCSSFILDFFSLVLIYYRDVQTEAPWNLLSYIPHPTLLIPIYSMMRELEDNGTLPSSWNCLSTSLCFLFKCLVCLYQF
jgi:hypothetical protein